MSFFGVPLRNGLPIGLGSSAGFGVPAFNPQQLFSNGEQGVWYDPSDFSTMFQDVAGTTPVTAVGQSVALIRDKSGNGNHATQSVLASMPTLNIDASGLYFLLFDGSNDSMLTSSINFSATNKATVFAGLRKISDAAVGTVVELSASSITNTGSFCVRAPQIAATYSVISSGSNAGILATTAASYAAPITNVLTGIFDISGDQAILRVNAVQAASNTADQGTGNFGNYPLFIGRRNNASLPFNGRLYSLIVRGAASTAVEVSNTEYWVANRTGISL